MRAPENENRTTSSSNGGDKTIEEYQANEKDIIVKMERAMPNGHLALTNATLITMSGQEIIDSGTIILKNNFMMYNESS